VHFDVIFIRLFVFANIFLVFILEKDFVFSEFIIILNIHWLVVLMLARPGFQVWIF